MASGGARARSGPAPDPNALARDRKTDRAWTNLPAEGRTGPTPAWPLAKNKKHETMWARLWRKPQAIMWEQMDLGDQLAAYVLAYNESVTPQASAGLKTAVLRMEDNLGISPAGMAAQRWKIAAKPTADEALPQSQTVGVVTDARSRFQHAATT